MTNQDKLTVTVVIGLLFLALFGEFIAQSAKVWFWHWMGWL